MKTKYVTSLVVILFITVACGNIKKTTETTTSKTQITKTISGSGSETQKITLNEGAAIFKYSYNGSGNFIVWLKDNNAKELALIENSIGSIKGSKSENIRQDGNYILDVEAEGSWTIEIK